jgi:hypothetical protein
MVVVALVSLVLSGDGTAFAQNPPGGRVAIGGEEVALAAPLWIWDAEAQFLSFAFFPDPPPPGAEEKAREFGDWYFDLPGRRVVLDVEFEAGQSMAMADQVTSCRVSAIGFRAELDLTGRAADCHILSIGGLLRPGGGVIGVVQGEGAGYSLHLPFSMTMGDIMTGTGAVAPPAARPPLPSNTVEGTADFDGQTVTVTHGLAWWDERRGQVRLGLFEREPPAGMLADLQGGSWGAGGPVVVLNLEVERRASVDVASVDYCYIGLSFPRGGTIGNNTNAQGCGLDEFGGEIAPGGHVIAGLSGQATGPQDKPYTWTLRFNLPLVR